MKRYLVIKDGKIYANMDEPYPPYIVRQMKQAGYKVKEVEEEEINGKYTH